MVNQLPKLLGAGDAPDQSSWTAIPKTAVGLLASALLQFQAKSPEQTFPSGVGCKDFSAHRISNTRTEYNRRGRSRNGLYDVGTNPMLIKISAVGGEHRRRDGRSCRRMRDGRPPE